MLSETFQQKITIPLGTVIHNLDAIENSREASPLLKKQIDSCKIQSMLLLFDLKNIQDWSNIKQGKFIRVSHKFNLEEAMDEVFKLMEFKCLIKNLQLKFNPKKSFLESN